MANVLNKLARGENEGKTPAQMSNFDKKAYNNMMLYLKEMKQYSNKNSDLAEQIFALSESSVEKLNEMHDILMDKTATAPEQQAETKKLLESTEHLQEEIGNLGRMLKAVYDRQGKAGEGTAAPVRQGAAASRELGELKDAWKQFEYQISQRLENHGSQVMGAVGNAGLDISNYMEDIQTSVERVRSGIDAINDINGAVATIQGSANTIQETMGGVSGSIEQVSKTVNETHGSVDNMAGSIDHVSKTVNETHDRVDNMADSIEQAGKAINETHSCVDNMAGSIEQVSKTINEMHGSVDNMTGSIEQVSKTMSETHSCIDNIAGRVSTMADSVSTIAEKVTDTTEGIEGVRKIVEAMRESVEVIQSVVERETAKRDSEEEDMLSAEVIQSLLQEGMENVEEHIRSLMIAQLHNQMAAINNTMQEKLENVQANGRNTQEMEQLIHNTVKGAFEEQRSNQDTAIASVIQSEMKAMAQGGVFDQSNYVAKAIGEEMNGFRDSFSDAVSEEIAQYNSDVKSMSQKTQDVFEESLENHERIIKKEISLIQEMIENAMEDHLEAVTHQLESTKKVMKGYARTAMWASCLALVILFLDILVL